MFTTGLAATIAVAVLVASPATSSSEPPDTLTDCPSSGSGLPPGGLPDIPLAASIAPSDNSTSVALNVDAVRPDPMRTHDGHDPHGRRVRDPDTRRRQPRPTQARRHRSRLTRPAPLGHLHPRWRIRDGKQGWFAPPADLSGRSRLHGRRNRVSDGPERSDVRRRRQRCQVRDPLSACSRRRLQHRPGQRRSVGGIGRRLHRRHGRRHERRSPIRGRRRSRPEQRRPGGRRHVRGLRPVPDDVRLRRRHAGVLGLLPAPRQRNG